LGFPLSVSTEIVAAGAIKAIFDCQLIYCLSIYRHSWTRTSYAVCDLKDHAGLIEAKVLTKLFHIFAVSTHFICQIYCIPFPSILK
jgi:hypothetical protein